jgi:ABC-type phosphate/phosphonate transport system substrate-binding protein
MFERRGIVMKVRLPAALAAVLLLLAAAFSGNAAAAEKYVLALPVVEGFGAGTLPKMLTELAKAISKKTGYDIQVKQIPYKKGEDDALFLRLLKEFKAGNADFTIVSSPIRFVKYEKQANDVMIPTFTTSIFGKKQEEVCVYVRKDDPAKTFTDLKGKRWGGLHTMSTRLLMNASSINSPMKDFFSGVKYIDDTNITQPLDMLMANKIDAHVTTSYVARMAIGGNKKYQAGIREFGCKDYELNWLFVYRKGVPPAAVEKIKAEMLKAHKDKDYAQFKFMLSAIKGQFVDFATGDLQTTRTTTALMLKFGWEKEEKEFLKAKPQ